MKPTPITHAKLLTGYIASAPLRPVACAGCGRPPNHIKAHAIGKEIIHCPRCDREVIRSLGSDNAICEWNKFNAAKG